MIAASTVIEVFKYVAIILVTLMLVGEISSFFNNETTDILQESYDAILNIDENTLLLKEDIPTGAALLFFNEGQDIEIVGEDDVSVTSFTQPEEGCEGSMCVCYCGRVTINGEQASCRPDSLECKPVSDYSIKQSTLIQNLYPGREYNTNPERFVNGETQEETPDVKEQYQDCYQLDNSRIQQYAFTGGVVLYNPPKPAFNPEIGRSYSIEEQCRQNMVSATLGYKYDFFSEFSYYLRFFRDEDTKSVSIRQVPPGNAMSDNYQ